MKDKYKDLTIEDIEKVVNELGFEPFVRELSSEEIEDKKMRLGNFALNALGANIYQIGGKGGPITGDGGLKLFQEAFLKEAKKWKTNL